VFDSIILVTHILLAEIEMLIMSFLGIAIIYFLGLMESYSDSSH